MKGAFKKMRVPACALLLAAGIFAAVCFFPAAGESMPPAAEAAVLRLWHIDGFEGGVGSRAVFLRSAARKFADGGGAYVLVTAQTAESARAALAAGDVPDMISCGGDNSFAAGYAAPLQGYAFAAAEAGGQTLAVPWCRGAYLLFSADGDFSDMNAQNTVYSQGRGAHPAAAAWFAGLRGVSGLPAGEAAAALMRGDRTYMLGTQRDVQRFSARSFAVQVRPVREYCDLWQYILVTAASAHYASCLDFIGYLLSADVQRGRACLGMLGAFGEVYEEGSALYGAWRAPARTLPAWADAEALREADALAEAALAGDENAAKKLENRTV